MIYRWKIFQLDDRAYLAKSPYNKYEFSRNLDNLIENILYKSYPKDKDMNEWVWDNRDVRFMFDYKPSQILKTIKNKYPEEFV